MKTFATRQAAEGRDQGRTAHDRGEISSAAHPSFIVPAAASAMRTLQRQIAESPRTRRSLPYRAIADGSVGPGGDGTECVQRRIASTPAGAGPQTFVRRGRSGEHNTAANRAALADLRHDRAVNASPANRHVNNEAEAAIGWGLPVPVPAIPLHMSHHVSDQTVQDTVAAAANAHNAGAGPGVWAPVHQLIAGINPAAAPVALPAVFNLHATASHGLAVAAVGAIPAAAPMPHNAASRTNLTSLASAIANSPMNLHHGIGQTNMSIGQHGDPNSFPTPMPAPLMSRRLSWRSHQMLANAPALLNYRTLAMAAAMPAGTVAAADAAALPIPAGYAGPPIVHSSGSPFHHFAALQ